MPDTTAPLLLIAAASFGTILYLLIIERKMNRIVDRRTPQLPDLAPYFADLQKHIKSDGLQTRQKVHEASESIYDALVRNLIAVQAEVRGEGWKIRLAGADSLKRTRELIADDGKLTRERIAQVKTRLTDEEKDDRANKDKARRATSTKLKKLKASK